MTIYELGDQWNRYYEMADDPYMDEDTWIEMMNSIQCDIKEKADGYAKLMKQFESDAAGIKAEVERLKARKQALENKTEALKQRLQDAMNNMDLKDIKTDLFSFKIQKNPASVFIADESLVPDVFKIPQDPKIDKKAIANLLKEGEQVEWASLEYSESLRIR